MEPVDGERVAMSGDWAAQVPQSGPGPSWAPTAPSGPGPAGSMHAIPMGPANRTAERPSLLPEANAIGALLFSLFLAVATAPEAILARLPFLSALAGPVAQLVATNRWTVRVALAGYALTPFWVVAALAWARATGLTRLDDPWFDRMRLRRQMRRLQAIALLAFLAAVPHIVIIARAIQSALGIGS